VQFRYYTQEVGSELAAGIVANVILTFDRPARDVWPYFKDFNSWQNSCDHYYSGVIGDLEGKTFRLSRTPNDGGPHQYRVQRVLPGYVIVLDQPGPWDGGPQLHDGYSVFMLSENSGRTTATIVMQHAVRSKGKTEEEALDHWRQLEAKLFGKWWDSFIPNLKSLVYQGSIA
jgi:hypothetical protein